MCGRGGEGEDHTGSDEEARYVLAAAGAFAARDRRSPAWRRANGALLVANVHFPSDVVAGLALGLVIGQPGRG